MNLILICAAIIPIVWTSPQNTQSELVDFEFDGVTSNGFSDTISKSDGIDRIDVNYADATDDNERNAFEAKEQRIRNSLVQATKEVTYMKKFTQILPIIRTLTKQQRLVLASLISAQASARSSGNVMNLAQVSFYFYLIYFGNWFLSIEISDSVGQCHARFFSFILENHFKL